MMSTEIPKALHLQEKVFSIANEKEFSEIALAVYHFQFDNNPLYRQYCQSVHKTPGTVTGMADIPFLPVSFFKTHQVATTAFEPELVFRSSGTTAATTSTHYVKDAALYHKSLSLGFERYFGAPQDFCILGLLPSYLERKDASLVYMVEQLIRQSGHADSGFYLYDTDRLAATLRRLEAEGQQTLLFGVSFALLDFCRAYPLELNFTRVLETGGMKGRGRELTREELNAVLKKNLGLTEVYSEYGMTELLSQAYGRDGIFSTPPWMRVLLRDASDPLSLLPPDQSASGVINVIDLANLYSCSFIATDDIGKMVPGGFEVLGRLDHADLRGCSQLAL